MFLTLFMTTIFFTESGPNGLKSLIKAIESKSKTQAFIAEKLKSAYNVLQNKEENIRK